MNESFCKEVVIIKFDQLIEFKGLERLEYYYTCRVKLFQGIVSIFNYYCLYLIREFGDFWLNIVECKK